MLHARWCAVGDVYVRGLARALGRTPVAVKAIHEGSPSRLSANECPQWASDGLERDALRALRGRELSLHVLFIVPEHHQRGVAEDARESARLVPSRDFGLEPHLAATSSEIDDRPWHVWVPALIEGHRVPLRQAEQVRHALGVNQIVGIDLPHHALKTTTVDRLR